MVQVVWMLEDAERAGGVESVVRAIAAGLGASGHTARVLSWWVEANPPGQGTHQNPFLWAGAKAQAARRRSRRARATAEAIDRRLAEEQDAVVVLDPGSLEVCARLRSRERWGLHIHWDPDLIMAPWRHIDTGEIPRVVRPVVALRLRWTGRRNRRVLRRAPFLVTITPAHSRQLAAVTQSIREIPNPVPVGPLPSRENIDADRAVIGFAGRLAWEKGPDVLLDAFRIVCRTHPAWRLVILGDGPMRSSLESDEASRCGEIEFRGWVDEVAEVLRRIDVLAVPSRSEAMGLVVIEALASGCAVVACDAGPGVRDVMGQGRLGRVIPPDAPDKLAAALVAAVGDRVAGRGPAPEEVAAAVLRHDPALVVSEWQDFLAGLVGRPTS